MPYSVEHNYSRPQVQMLFDYEGVTYLVMDTISGKTLEAVTFWMEPTALKKTAQQLRKVES